ncbi:magnesium transport protein CorA [Tsukamurella pulmonis]|uniref:Magnesium transporter n=1 Tax=Tsukamurella pulmonis TaxID=47312 RepID=A0A1H1DLU2_9ACTN|nr:magnesium and cobalt transport protein CorA [Tsukamurella pulmonis]KXO92281.1 magnesium transporter CorA [Tsukamurella pulmonis]KXP09924.1 magnesium transporter CorA [Tsukamurella pulmonis]RDH11503.1 magnesium and cobalt transport protein CorA [Tsukamurella pulmonis]SDQ77511.1 magnesium transporter [Tsukamurella pulmonis]SUP21914.1 Magnesium transport protein CorA [Tsukamurella pulmonis]
MIVDCAHYLGGARQAEEALSPLDAARLCTEDGFVWLGLFEPTPDEMESVRQAFDLHELAVEDAQDYHLRPKVEDFEASVKLVILRTARYDDAREEVDFGEISIFVGRNFVITVRQGVASELHEARARLEQKPELLALGTDAVLWAILDQVVDGYEPVVAGLEHDIEQIEATVFSGAVAPTERIYLLRREVTNFYRAAHPLLAVVNAVGKGLTEDKLAPYLRDVYDRLQLVNEEVSAQRDLLGTILQANIAVVSVQQAHSAARQSSTIERLTILSTIFLPLTFVTGFFGQNFGWLVDHIGGAWQFFFLGLGGLLVPLVALALWLRRNKAPEVDPFAASHDGAPRAGRL